MTFERLEVEAPCSSSPTQDLGFFLLFEIHILKGVYAARTMVPNGRMKLRAAHVDMQVARHIDFQNFFETSSFPEKTVIVPEVSRRNRVTDSPAGVNFQPISNGKRLNRNVFLPLVCVHRGFPADRGVHFLNI